MTMTVALPPEVKGTHMSRFVELLEWRRGEIAAEALPGLLDEMLIRLDADSGRIDMRFPWFIRKEAPVSRVDSLLDIDVAYLVEKGASGETSVTLEVVVPVTSLCPCSKKISDYGAHNQRSHLTLSVTLREAMSVAELVRIAEDEASCEVFGLLKRPDEKWVTERAYDNPKFVEDLVRDIALRLGNDVRIARWKVASENFESIHNHSAYAELWGENV
jgi:GTP cyclohydrolase I